MKIQRLFSRRPIVLAKNELPQRPFTAEQEWIIIRHLTDKQLANDLEHAKQFVEKQEGKKWHQITKEWAEKELKP